MSDNEEFDERLYLWMMPHIHPFVNSSIYLLMFVSPIYLAMPMIILVLI